MIDYTASAPIGPRVIAVTTRPHEERQRGRVWRKEGAFLLPRCSAGHFRLKRTPSEELD